MPYELNSLNIGAHITTTVGHRDDKQLFLSAGCPVNFKHFDKIYNDRFLLRVNVKDKLLIITDLTIPKPNAATLELKIVHKYEDKSVWVVEDLPIRDKQYLDNKFVTKHPLPMADGSFQELSIIDYLDKLNIFISGEDEFDYFFDQRSQWQLRERWWVRDGYQRVTMPTQQDGFIFGIYETKFEDFLNKQQDFNLLSNNCADHAFYALYECCSPEHKRFLDDFTTHINTYYPILAPSLRRYYTISNYQIPIPGSFCRPRRPDSVLATADALRQYIQLQTLDAVDLSTNDKVKQYLKIEVMRVEDALHNQQDRSKAKYFALMLVTGFAILIASWFWRRQQQHKLDVLQDIIRWANTRPNDDLSAMLDSHLFEQSFLVRILFWRKLQDDLKYMKESQPKIVVEEQNSVDGSNLPATSSSCPGYENFITTNGNDFSVGNNPIIVGQAQQLNSDSTVPKFT